MFSGGEKNSFFYFSVIDNDTIATLTEKNRNFTCSYKILRYQDVKVLYFPPECGFACPAGADKG
jgi:hypothetical protein